jgi:predicted nucleic-acid-binding protein
MGLVGSQVKIAVDTHVLVRAAVRDDATQANIAAKLLTDAELVAVALPCLCEFAWVLRRVYGFAPADVADAIRALLDAANTETHRPAAEADLAVLEAGGDFADGAIAFEGQWLGGGTFVSFDKKVVTLLTAQGQSARLLVRPNRGSNRTQVRSLMATSLSALLPLSTLDSCTD